MTRVALALSVLVTAAAQPAHAGLVGPAILRTTGPAEIDLYAAHYPYYHGGQYWRYRYHGGYYNYYHGGHYYPYYYRGSYCYQRYWRSGGWYC